MATTKKLPEPATNLELSRLMGAWYLLITNYEFWRERTHPRIEYDLLEPAGDGRLRFRDSLRYRGHDLLGRPQQRRLAGVDVAEDGGAFVRRGDGLMRLLPSRWCVPLIDPNYRWVITWSRRSSVGTGAGLDIYTRDPWIPQVLLDEILAEVNAHPFLGTGRRARGLFATIQDWIPPQPYRLG